MEYDLLSDIYEMWSTGDDAYFPSGDFYRKLAARISGHVVEIGVGTGRIAIDIARQGIKVTGIDISANMLAQLRTRASMQGVEENIAIMLADAKDFKLDCKADLVCIPFRSFGHFLTREEKYEVLMNVKSQLSDKGILVFDHYLFNETWAKNHERTPRLMFSGNDPQGHSYYIWDTYIYHYEKQIMDCTITVECLADSEVISRRHCPLTFSWVYVDQVRSLLKDTGYEIVSLLGGFDGQEFTEYSTDQIWIVRPQKIDA